MKRLTNLRLVLMLSLILNERNNSRKVCVHCCTHAKARWTCWFAFKNAAMLADGEVVGYVCG